MLSACPADADLSRRRPFGFMDAKTKNAPGWRAPILHANPPSFRGFASAKSPEPMNTGSDEKACRDRRAFGWAVVFMGSGLGPAARPGMTARFGQTGERKHGIAVVRHSRAEARADPRKPGRPSMPGVPSGPRCPG